MRTHFCGSVSETDVGNTVTLYGWVDRRRDHGGVIFLDMRDREGVVQVVFDPDTELAFALADKVRSEYVLKITGRVRERGEGTINPNMATGTIEVLGKELELLSESATPPFPLDEHHSVGEDVRLKFRYLDLRRPEMQHNLMFRARLTASIRRYLEEQGFLDIETPLLTRATPEGARDYLVPSRTHAGRFFALPQSPQLFKQLLMVSGFDRYYQIARCFRDEDLRADRQPEFTQIDIETSFLDEPEIMALTEGLVRSLFDQHLGVDLGDFPHMTWHEVIFMFGLGLREPGAAAPVGRGRKMEERTPDWLPGFASCHQELANSFIFFRGRILTAVLAGLALNMVSSPVKGLMPLRALTAGLRTVMTFIRPGIVNSPAPRFLMLPSIRFSSCCMTSDTCFLLRPVLSAMVPTICVLVIFSEMAFTLAGAAAGAFLAGAFLAAAFFAGAFLAAAFLVAMGLFHLW